MMTDQKIINNWLYAFAKDVDKRSLTDHVLSLGNLMWHIFSYKYVPCLEGDEARAEFDRIKYDKAICFYEGYAGKISKVSEVGKLTAKTLDKLPCCDVYIVAEDFSWTYVRTHEYDCYGPYFCYRKPESWAIQKNFSENDT